MADGGRKRQAQHHHDGQSGYALTRGLCPVATIDVWEHAYYLKHYNDRVGYIDDWFQVADWERAGELYRLCIGEWG